MAEPVITRPPAAGALPDRRWTGLPALLPRWEHAAVWLLLSAALLTARLRDGWSWVSAALASGAGPSHDALLAVVVTS